MSSTRLSLHHEKGIYFDIQGPVVSHVGDHRDKKTNALNGLTPSVEEHSFDISLHYWCWHHILSALCTLDVSISPF